MGKHRLRETATTLQQGKHWAHGENRETQVKRKPGENLPHEVVEDKARDIKEERDKS